MRRTAAAVNFKVLPAALLVAAVATGVGCQPKYENERPPIDQLDARDKGLQSVDLLQASDLMAQSLLSYPGLAGSDRQYLIVVGNIENQTSTLRGRNLDIFLDRLKTNLSKQGRGRVTLIENRARFRQMQSKELEPGAGDPFGQGGGPVQPGPAGIQPDYELYGKIQDLPNRGTNTYRFEFNLSGLQGQNARVLPWSDEYIVKVAR
ncbi:MAG TPA: hypothetical protein VK324_11010 [Tepidisphaeraceae bacterium]|nr:hypothetical protein [Tepidisphaeraceae bacterium]